MLTDDGFSPINQARASRRPSSASAAGSGRRRRRRGGQRRGEASPPTHRLTRVQTGLDVSTRKKKTKNHTHSLHMWSRCRWRGRTASKPKTRSGFPSASPLSWSSTSSTSRREAREEVIPVVETKSNNPKDVCCFFMCIYIF